MPELHPDQIQLVERLLEHSRFVTVETARALLRHSSRCYALIESLGCPSLMISPIASTA